MKTIAIIMAGGSGERFWPLSRCAYPKQLLKLKNGQHMLSMAIQRIAPVVAPEDVYILTVGALVEAICEETPELPPGNVIAEPEARNTAACLTLAAAMVSQRYGDETVVIVLTADHFIQDEKAFQRDCKAAADFAASHDALLTFGIRPTRPETGYGYIDVGDPASDRYPIFRVKSFREKPDAETARRFLEDGDFFWNSGMFVWKNSVFLDELARHLPVMAGAVPELKTALDAEDPRGELGKVYSRLEKISIDVGLMERSERVYVLRASFDWDDIGTWSSLYRILQPDAAGNAVYGNGMFIQSQNSIAYSTEDATNGKQAPLVIGYNVDGLVIVNTPDAVLVLPAADVQRVKDIVAFLRSRGKSEYL